ncbi:MAG: AsmA family protein, partial [Sinobacteraceae bacterium]|nr:AsmA family protein [Nevskiaceae bacterium]
MKIFKYLGLTLAAVVALLVLLIVAVALFFDPDDHKAQLQQVVEQKTGRTLQLPGRLELTWFPWLAVEFGPAALGNAPGFGEQPFLELGRARLGVRLSGLLLRRRLEFDTLRIERPVLRLAIDAAGRDNWTDLVEQLTAEPASPATPAGETPFAVAFSGLRVAGGALELADAREASRLELLDLDVQTGALQAGVPFDLHAGFTYRSDPSAAIATRLAARTTLDPDRSRLRLEEPSFELRLQGEGWPDTGLPLNVRSGPVELDWDAQTLAMPDLVVESLGARLSGALTGKQIIDAPQLSGPLRLETLALRDWLVKAGIAPPVTRDPKAFGSLAFSGQLEFTPKAFALESLQLRLDDSTVTGRVGVADLDAGILPLRFTLGVDRIDVDRYLSPESEGASSAGAGGSGEADADAARASASAGAAEEPVALPVELLRGLDMVGQLDLGQGQFAGMSVSAVRLGVNAKQAKLRLFPL